MIVEPKITQIETLNFRAKFNPNVNMIVNLVFPAFFVPIVPLHYTLSRFTVFENHPKGRIWIFYLFSIEIDLPVKFGLQCWIRLFQWFSNTVGLSPNPPFLGSLCVSESDKRFTFLQMVFVPTCVVNSIVWHIPWVSISESHMDFFMAPGYFML